MNDSQLANDRTFLAWLRTGIALFGFGFVVAKVALIVDPGNQGVSDKVLYTGVGVLMVLSRAALNSRTKCGLVKLPSARLAPWPLEAVERTVESRLMLDVLVSGDVGQSLSSLVSVAGWA